MWAAAFLFILALACGFMAMLTLFGSMAVLSGLAGSFFVCAAVFLAASFVLDMLDDIRRAIRKK